MSMNVSKIFMIHYMVFNEYSCSVADFKINYSNSWENYSYYSYSFPNNKNHYLQIILKRIWIIIIILTTNLNNIHSHYWNEFILILADFFQIWNACGATYNIHECPRMFQKYLWLITWVLMSIHVASQTLK